MVQSRTPLTRDEYNRHWIMRTSTAHDLEQLAAMVAEAMQSDHWNGKLAKHASAVMVSLWQRGNRS